MTQKTIPKSFPIYPGTIWPALKRFQADHPEVSISRICVDLLRTYLAQRGYH